MVLITSPDAYISWDALSFLFAMMDHSDLYLLCHDVIALAMDTTAEDVLMRGPFHEQFFNRNSNWMEK